MMITGESVVPLELEAIEEECKRELEALKERWSLVDAWYDGLVTEAELDEALLFWEVGENTDRSDGRIIKSREIKEDQMESKGFAEDVIAKDGPVRVEGIRRTVASQPHGMAQWLVMVMAITADGQAQFTALVGQVRWEDQRLVPDEGDGDD